MIKRRVDFPILMRQLSIVSKVTGEFLMSWVTTE